MTGLEAGTTYYVVVFLVAAAPAPARVPVTAA
jgi:hypothetical protein